MILCQCAGVTDSMIVRVIEQGAATVADITRITGAGRCCLPCRQEIAKLLSTANPSRPSLNIAAESRPASQIAV